MLLWLSVSRSLGSRAGTFVPRVRALFGNGVEPLGSGSWLEKMSYQRRAFEVYNPAQLPVPALLSTL